MKDGYEVAPTLQTGPLKPDRTSRNNLRERSSASAPAGSRRN